MAGVRPKFPLFPGRACAVRACQMAAESEFGLLDDSRFINIAIGMLMGRLTITDTDAYDLLLEASVSSYRSLPDVSRSYVESPN